MPSRHVPSPSTPTRHRRRFLLATTIVLGALGWTASTTAHALGHRLGVTVIDRDTGQPLTVHAHRGRHYIAGRPGARYAVRLDNRTGARVLAVVSVDGVNVVTGQTAAWHQSGYVLSPGQGYDIAGWRKSEQEVAAFEFTALPDSYAARTGRPLDVGVIGVAVFAERPAPPPPPLPEPAEIARNGAAREAPAAADSAAAKAAPDRLAAPRAAERLGTGHGARESSKVTSTHFERSSSQPVELLALHYDRRDNLVRAGVIPHVDRARPRPFPRSTPDVDYVPDPPAR